MRGQVDNILVAHSQHRSWRRTVANIRAVAAEVPLGEVPVDAAVLVAYEILKAARYPTPALDAVDLIDNAAVWDRLGPPASRG